MMPFFEGIRGRWNWFSDGWLVSRQAIRFFFVAVVFVLALTPIFLGSDAPGNDVPAAQATVDRCRNGGNDFVVFSLVWHVALLGTA